MRSRHDPRFAAALAAALVLALAPGCARKPPAPPSSLTEAQAIAARTGKPVLIDFFAVW